MNRPKTKFLTYSHSKFNQVVWCYAELEKACDGVYTYLKCKDQYREQDDQIGIVLQLESVFFEYGTYSRRLLANQNVAEAGTKMLANFHSTIQQTMQDGKHLQLLFVRIYEEMGRDTAPLIRYREERRLRLQQEEEEERRRKEEQQRQAEEQKLELLRKEGEKFAAGEFISSEHFIVLCRLEQIPIPIRTHGTLRQSVEELSCQNGIRYIRKRGKPAPKFNGCFLLIKALHSKLTAK